MEGQSSKVGIIAAALLAAVIVWGWPRVFPPSAKPQPVHSPIVAFQDQMRRQMSQVDATAPSVSASAKPASQAAGAQSRPWLAPTSSVSPVPASSTQAASSDDAPRYVTVIVVTSEPIESRQSALAHEAYAEIQGRIRVTARSSSSPLAPESR